MTHPAAVGRVAGLSSRVNATVRPPTIESRLSVPARNALRGMQRGPFLPRASPASKNVTQVGLGTARNFSTTRPIFEHLVQNVPVAARAICEADLDVEKRKMRAKRSNALKKFAKVGKARKSLLKPTSKKTTIVPEELERYFPEVVPSVLSPGTSTILLVPLAPTSTSSYSLSDNESLRLMPRSDLRDILSSHRKHQLRVSSLFARLDANKVWDDGASFSAHGDASGLCTLLRVEFSGWSEEDVREVLGDAGRGWCEVIEMKDECDEKISSIGCESGFSSSISTRSTSPETFDPSASVVLPTLDFSASFMATQTCSPSSDSQSMPPSPPMSLPGSGYSSPMFGLSSLSPSEIGDVDVDQAMEMEFDDGFSNISCSGSPDWTEIELASVVDGSAGSVMGLSAAFLERSEAEIREVTH